MAGAADGTRMAFSILLLFYAIVFCPVKVAIAGKAEKLEDGEQKLRKIFIYLQSPRIEGSSQMKSCEGSGKL